MESEKITSRHNTLAKHARAVRDGREALAQIFIEGLRLSEEAVRSRLVVQDALYTERFEGEERGLALLKELKQTGARLSLVSDDVMSSVSDTRTPQGIALLASRPHTGSDRLSAALKAASSNPLLVIIHGINNPANAGAILRTAEAAGAQGIISTKGTTDLFNTKALRGSMGSGFRLPMWERAEFAEVLAWCRGNRIHTVGSSLKASASHTEVDWTRACALVIGAEAAGLGTGELSMLDETTRIPMRPPVESLNAAVASGIILYEAARQRAGFTH
ncbi:MAG TPA: RNA methyltransferase [Pyrinomonadaceae bacterium]|nr:RNA methyltransferase [Pyrinomonadaceae bacterium]